MSLRILITGSREWTDRDTIRAALVKAMHVYGARTEDVTVVHGAAAGADTIAADIATEFGCDVEIHPADWKQYGHRAGPIRNQRMVNSDADLVLAFPLGKSNGTRDCVRRARKAGIPVIEHGEPTP